MKKIIVILCLFLVSKVFCQEINTSKIVEIPTSYANHLGEPIGVKKDSLYLFRTADIYLVNKKSFLAIKSVYQSTLDKDKMTEQLIEKYTQTLHKNIDLESELSANFTKTDSLDQVVYQKMQSTLDNTQKALDYTVNSLEKATNSLELVENLTKRQRRKSFFEKVIVAIAGIGAGVLVGVSL